jgi:hypothetical protein
VLGLVALLLVLGLSDGGEDDEAREGRGKAEREEGGKGGGGGDGSGGGKKKRVPDTVELELVPRADSQVCLVNKGGAVLIDGQVLSSGDSESFEADAFDLSVGFGDLEVVVNGDADRVRVKSDSPVTYALTPKGLRQPVPDADYPECP